MLGGLVVLQAPLQFLLPDAKEAEHLEQRVQSRALCIWFIRQARARQVVGGDVAIS